MKTMERPNKTMHKSQRLINHVALVLDGSGSMSGHRQNVVKVTDEQIKHLMEKSEELTQETRVSIYLFHSHSEVDCVIFDQDVMRLPSIESLYKTQGGTPLIDAVIKSQQDLATTSQIYGDHGFLTFVITDGQENTSKAKFSDLRKTMESMPENWTMGFFVPDESSVAYLSRAGVPEDSIVTWDTSSSGGMLQVGQRIQAATSQYLEQRAQGVRGTRSVFSVAKTGADAVNKKTVAASLNPFGPPSFGSRERDDYMAMLRQRLNNPFSPTAKVIGGVAGVAYDWNVPVGAITPLPAQSVIGASVAGNAVALTLGGGLN